jgi:plastocyanin
MKKLVALLVLFVGFAFTANAQEAKKVKTVTLEQTPGEFTQKKITLSEGTYIFEIANNNVGHNVGFVLAPKSDVKKHIKEAYVTKPVTNNSKSTSKKVTLTKGEYVYFCPLNPTPQYTLVVE